MQARWDGDERGRGVASASGELGAVDRLRAAMNAVDWIAEDPEKHLLSGLSDACREHGWTLVRSETRDAVLEVEVAAPASSRRALRTVAFALIGSFAELSTHVVEEPHTDRAVMRLVVTTGILEGDSRFAPHGHVIRLVLHGA
jgi:hypothetical protein